MLPVPTSLNISAAQANNEQSITRSETTSLEDLPVARAIYFGQLLVHPLAGSIITNAHAAVLLFNHPGILCHSCTYLRCRGTMPVGSRKQANGDRESRTYLRAVKW